MFKITFLNNLFHRVNKKLQFRLRLYFLISLVMLAIVGYDIFKGYIGIPFSAMFILIGIVLGIVTARMYHISWDHDAQEVMAKLDTFGIVILVCYILFSLFRSKIIEYFVHGPTVGAASFSIVAGMMIGRVIGTRGKILKVLKQQHVF